MQTITINTFKYDELSEEAKEKAMETMHTINVDHDWWDFIYEDAMTIGLKITGFDIDRGSYCEGDFTEDEKDVAALIIENHGEICETHKTTQEYLTEYNKLVDSCRDDEDINTEDIDKEFEQSILEDYRIMLTREYDFLTGEDAVIETIECNDYNFTDNGELI